MTISFEKFKETIELIQSFDEKRRRIGKFFEEELMPDSWCIFTFGEELETALINLLADEFNCSFEYQTGTKSNDIEWWLYDSCDESKTIVINNEEKNLSDIKEFYDYLIKEKETKDEQRTS